MGQRIQALIEISQVAELLSSGNALVVWHGYASCLQRAWHVQRENEPAKQQGSLWLRDVHVQVLAAESHLRRWAAAVLAGQRLVGSSSTACSKLTSAANLEH